MVMKKVQKISILISSYDDLRNPYYAGGGAHAIHEIAKRLSSKYDVTILTGSYPGSKNEIRDGVTYQRVGLSYLGGKIGQLSYQLTLPWHVITKQYDVWMESFTPPFSTNCLQLFTKKPVIGIVHMLAGEDMRRKYKLPFDSSEKIGLRTYKYLIVLSDSMKEKIQKINKNVEIAVIPNGVEIFKNQSNLPVKHVQKHILFLGRLEVNQKGIDLLLESYALNSKAIKYDLVLAGSGEKKEIQKVQRLIKQLNLSRRVKLSGRVEGAKKEKLFSEAVCIVIPSRFETYSIVALEALAHNVPVIAFDIEGLSWIPKGVAVKVRKFNKEELSKAIIAVSQNPDTAALMKQKGRDYARKLTWDTITTLYEKYLNHVQKLQ